jgi:hypothetical protein
MQGIPAAPMPRAASCAMRLQSASREKKGSCVSPVAMQARNAVEIAMLQLAMADASTSRGPTQMGPTIILSVTRASACRTPASSPRSPPQSPLQSPPQSHQRSHHQSPLQKGARSLESQSRTGSQSSRARHAQRKSPLAAATSPARARSAMLERQVISR